jgi:cytoskeletal protein CcmA (bactofilin family)
MNRTLRFLLLATSLLLALVPVAAFAADGSGDGDLLLRINGPITVGPDQTYDNVVVISDNATIEGTLTGSLFVIGGDAIITGRVDTDVTVVSGTLTLASTAQVSNVSVIRGTLQRDAGATVTGDITRSNIAIDWWALGIVSAFIWAGVTLAVLLAGAIFAGIAGRSLKTAGDMISRETGPAILAALLIWIALPVAMVMAFFTLVGIPIGLGYFLFVLPVLWFLGYLVTGTLIGRVIVHRTVESERPYLASVIGLLILQVAGLVPWLGGVLGFLAGVIGSGALVLLAWRAWRGPHAAQPAPPVITTGTPAPA